MSGQVRRTGFSASGGAGWYPDRTASWRGGIDETWWHPKALLAFDFVSGRAFRHMTEPLLTSALALTRAGNAKMLDADGVWQSFSSNVLARVGGIGADLYAGYTNKIRNPRGEGGVIGPVGLSNLFLSSEQFDHAVWLKSNVSVTPNAVVAPDGTFTADRAVEGVFAGSVAQSRTDATILGSTRYSYGVFAKKDTRRWLTLGLQGSVVANGRTWFDLDAGVVGTKQSGLASAGMVDCGDGWYFCYVRFTSDPTAGGVRTFYLGHVNADNSTSSAGDGVSGLYLWGAVLYSNWLPFTNPLSLYVRSVGVQGTSAGALPTNWATAGAPSGVNVQFLGTGEEGGLPYCDIRILGIADANAASHRVSFNDNTNAAATAGQAWGLDFRAKLIAGSAPSVVARLAAYATGSLLAGANDSGATTPDATVKYLSVRKVLADPTANNVRGSIVMPLVNGVTYDFTIRIYAPKLVQLPVIEGAELVANGGFAADTVWTKGAGCAISDGKGNVNSGVDVAAYEQSVGTDVTVYKVALTVSNYVAGTCRVELRPAMTIAGSDRSANGTYTEYLAGGAGNTVVRIRAGASPTVQLSVDDISVRQVSAGYLPDFPILPVAGAPGDSVRAADVAMAEDFASGVAPAIATGACALVGVGISYAGDGVVRTLFEISDNSANNLIRGFIGTANKPGLLIVSGGVTQTICELPVQAVEIAQLAFGWNGEGGYIADQAGNAVTFGAVVLPVGLSHFQIGGGIAGHYVNDWLRQTQITLPLSLAEAKVWTAAA